MKILPLINPFVQFVRESMNSFSAKKQKWIENFGHAFKNLSETFTRSSQVSNKVSRETAKKETADKTDEIAGNTLEQTPSPKPANPIQTYTLSSELPLDTKGIIKKLDNGFGYAVRKHAHPYKQTACLRLVVKAGSTDEEQGQEGLAHFYEHLAFCETESYKNKNDIKKYFESQGAVFGADQNAHTSYNQTVYRFDIPLKDPETLDKALHILREMTTKAKLSDSSVEEEREIILDEIQKENYGTRYRHKRDAILLAGTPYVDRKPAGLEKVIRECTPDQIRAFHDRTYQPQNMALVAVGDFDPEEVEKLICKHFSDMPASNDKALVHDFKPVLSKETQYLFHSDPESSSSVIQIYYPFKTSKEKQKPTLNNILQGMINKFYHILFNKRLQEIVSDTNSAPFSLATGNKVELMDNIFYYQLSIVAHDGEISEAYKRVLLELKRLKEHGFTNEEMELAVKSYLKQLEFAQQNKDDLTTEDFTKAYVAHFTDGDLIIDAEKLLKIRKALVGLIRTEHVNLWGNVLTSTPCSLVSVLVPSNSNEMISEEVFKKIQEEVLSEKTAPYTSTFVSRPLLRNEPQSGKIVQTHFYEKMEITEWVLENGMRVFVKPSKHQTDIIKIYCSRKNGLLHAPFEKRAAAEMSLSVLAGSERAGLTPTQLSKVMNEKITNQRLLIGNYMTSCVTESSKKDFESAFQLIHTLYTDQTYSEEVFNKVKKRELNQTKHLNNNPQEIFYQAHVDLCTQNHPRFKPISKEEFEKADFQDCVNFLNDQFQNASDFDFVICGNLDFKDTQEFVERYLAGVPGKGRSSMDLNKLPRYEYPAGIVTKDIEAGIAGSCKTHISFPSPAGDDFESRELGSWTAQLLTIHLYDMLTVGGKKSYGVDCDYVITKLPGLETIDPSSMELEFTSLPENIHEVNQTVLNELKRLHVEGFTKEEVDLYKIQLKEEFRKDCEDDSSLMSMIISSVNWNFDLNNIIENYSKLIESFDEKMATETFRKLFPLDRYVQVTLLPKKTGIETGVSARASE